MRQTWLIVLLLAVALVSCPTLTPSKVAQVLITPPGTTLVLGAGQEFTATVTDGAGAVLTEAVTWTSSAPTVVSINASGEAVAVADGQASITASAGGVTSQAVAVTVAEAKKGVATLAAPTATDPSATVQLPVVVFDDYALYQGDIIFDLSSVQQSANGWVSLRPQGNVVPALRGKLWANRTMNYYLEPGLPQEIKTKVVQAADAFRDKAGITLNQIFNPVGDYVHVFLADPTKPICGDSKVGRQGGGQVVHFQVGCPLRAYLHEFGHALGLWHEQSRADRSNYITVLYDNILDAYKDQYNLTGAEGFADRGYDYTSVMHYPARNGFSKLDKGGNPLPTFSVVGVFDINRVGGSELSQGDLLALSDLYGNIPPSVTLVSPLGSTTQVEIADPLGLLMEVSATDVEDGGACCKLTWFSWKDGVFATATGSDSHLLYSFKTLGAQLVTVTAEDSKGASDSVNFAVNVTHAKPDATIANPAPAQTVHRNLAFQIAKLANVAQDGPWNVNCTWTIPGFASSSTHCASSVFLGNSFPKGPLAITLSLSDKYGGANSSTVNVNVDELATLGVSIVTPANNASGSVNAGAIVSLERSMVNAVLPISRVWTWQPSAQGCAAQTLTLKPPVVIQPGTNPDGYWDLTNQVSVAPYGCGWGDGVLSVSVTDQNNQTASASINYRVQYTPPPK